jgi:hypothetical protein
VMSSSSMNTPVQTATNVHHLRAMMFPLFSEFVLSICTVQVAGARLRYRGGT